MAIAQSEITSYIPIIETQYVAPPQEITSEHLQPVGIPEVFRSALQEETVVFESPRPARTEQRTAQRERHRQEQLTNVRWELAALQRLQILGAYTRKEANSTRQPLIRAYHHLENTIQKHDE